MGRQFYQFPQLARKLLSRVSHHSEFLVAKANANETWWDFRHVTTIGAVDVVEVRLPDGRQCFTVSVGHGNSMAFQSEMKRQQRDCWQLTIDGQLQIGNSVVGFLECQFRRDAFPKVPHLKELFIPELVSHFAETVGLSREFLIEKTYESETSADVIRDYDGRTAPPPDLPLAWPLTLRAPGGSEYFALSLHNHRYECFPYLEEYSHLTRKHLIEMTLDKGLVLAGSGNTLNQFTVTVERPGRKPPAYRRKRRKNVVDLASRALEAEGKTVASALIFDCSNDEDRHDDDLQNEICQHFSKQFHESLAELTAVYGPPVELGEVDHGTIPMGGVFEFAIWNVQGRRLFLAVAHEDRELPYWLRVGTTNKK